MTSAHNNVSDLSDNRHFAAALWIITWLLHLPKPVLAIFNETNGPLLGVLYRYDNLLLTLNIMLAVSCPLMAINLHRGLRRLGITPFRLPLFWGFPCAMFILPVFSAIGAMLWLRGKQLAVTDAYRKKAGTSLRATGIFLVIAGWLFWINSFPAFQGYVLRSVIADKVREAEQAVSLADGAFKDHDFSVARQEIRRGKEQLRQAASYRFPYRQEEMKRVELALSELEQALERQEQKENDFYGRQGAVKSCRQWRTAWHILDERDKGHDYIR